MIGVFLFVACLAAGVSVLTDIESKKADLEQVQNDLKNVQRDLDSRAATNSRNRESYENLKSTVDRHDHAISRKKELEREVARLEDEKRMLLQSFKDAVVQVRSVSAGMVWPDFNHTNGQTLRGVKIQKATDTEVTVSHNEGVVKLTGEALTPELKARFRIGMVPVVVE